MKKRGKLSDKIKYIVFTAFSGQECILMRWLQHNYIFVRNDQARKALNLTFFQFSDQIGWKLIWRNEWVRKEAEKGNYSFFLSDQRWKATFSLAEVIFTWVNSLRNNFLFRLIKRNKCLCGQITMSIMFTHMDEPLKKIMVCCHSTEKRGFLPQFFYT